MVGTASECRAAAKEKKAVPTVVGQFSQESPKGPVQITSQAGRRDQPAGAATLQQLCSNSNIRRNVRLWHKADMAIAFSDVRFRG
jgi:hypothetical protein